MTRWGGGRVTLQIKGEMMRVRSIVSWLLLSLALLQCAKLIVGASNRVVDLALGRPRADDRYEYA